MDGDRALLPALPLPLAQAWRRTLYAGTPAETHERALFTLEAALKYLGSLAAAAWVARAAGGDTARSACEALVRPSVGQWAAILRSCAAALPADDPARRWLERVYAHPVTTSVEGLGSANVGAVLEGLPAYRNRVVHGAGLTTASLTERAPALAALTREVLTGFVGEGSPVLGAHAAGRRVRLQGPTAVLEDSVPVEADATVLRFGERSVTLSPLWIFDPEEDDLLVLNKGAGLAKVEYLSYGAPRGGTGLVVLKGEAATAAARFLELAAGRGRLESGDVEALIEETEARELSGRATSQRIGPYRIVRPLRRGGQGVLYEAIQEDPPRRVALKALPVQAAVDEAARRRMREEALALARVEHPGVVPVYAAGEHEGVPWIAMKFIEGRSLAEALEALGSRRGPVTLAGWNRAAGTRIERADEDPRRSTADRLAEIGRDVARALQACHERGIVHRDVKPGNIMLDEEGRALLTDFGLARPLEGRTRTFTRQLVGTLQYLAPEALLPSGRAGPDARVDVYGLGATLYEALALRRPFAEFESEEGALLHAVQTKDPPSLRRVAPWVPRDLETIVAKALEKDRDRRYRTAAELADDLDRHLRKEPIRARPAGLPARALKWARRNPAKAVVAGAAVLLVIVGAGAAVQQERRARASALRDAEEARREAGEKSREHARLWREVLKKRDQVASLRDACMNHYAPRDRREALNRLEDELAGDEDRLARLATEGREALERARRREAWYHGEKGSAKTVAAYAAHFLGLWRMALEAQDAGARQLYADEVERYDPGNPELLGLGRLTVSLSPRHAELYLFRYEPYESVRRDRAVVSRLVPVPVKGRGRCREGAWAGDFLPGDACLVILGVAPGSPAAQAGLRRGDLVTMVGDRPSGEGLLVREVSRAGASGRAGVRPWDPVESVDGARVDGWVQWPGPRTKGSPAPPGHQYVIAGKAIEGPRPGFTVVSPADQVGEPAPADGPVRLTCLRGGAPVVFDVPVGESSGLTCEVTAYPLILAENRIEPGAALEVEPGSYLLLARNEGYEDQRYPVLIGHGGSESVRIELRREGSTPPGFVHVPRAKFVYGGDPQALNGVAKEVVEDLEEFMIARQEVTLREWLDFVNDPEVLRRIDEEGERKRLVYVPRNQAGFLTLIGRDGKGFVSRLDPELPVMGVSWEDIQAFLEWKNRREPSWRHALPTERQWEKAARGADGRFFPWGDRFDFTLTVGWWSEPTWDGVGVGERGGFEPRDESPFGVSDLGGSRWEWTASRYDPNEPDPEKITYMVRGGSWREVFERVFRSTDRRATRPMVTSDNYGFRLVAAPK